jgi:hypothetical protein
MITDQPADCGAALRAEQRGNAQPVSAWARRVRLAFQ